MQRRRGAHDHVVPPLARELKVVHKVPAVDERTLRRIAQLADDREGISLPVCGERREVGLCVGK